MSHSTVSKLRRTMVDNSRIEQEIRFRSASNMQNVWEQLLFAQKMDGETGSVKEAEAFLGEIGERILGYIQNGKKLTREDILALTEKHPMKATSAAADIYSGIKENRTGLIPQAIAEFLQSCQLIDNVEFGEERWYVNDVTNWWYSRLGAMCSEDSCFWNEGFLEWLNGGSSLYFLLNYRVNESLLKSYVSSWEVNPREMLQMSTDYRHDEQIEAYLEHYRSTPDAGMADMAHVIIQNEACLVYHDKLWHVTSMLAEAGLHQEMAELFVKIDYPVLQASMMTAITDVESLLAMMEKLLAMDIPHPLTSFSILREHLYDLCARTTANLLSYQEEFYGKKPSQELQDQCSEVEAKWRHDLPGYFKRGLEMLKCRLAPKNVAGWAFARQEIVPPRKNATSDGYNQCTKVMKEAVLSVYKADELPVASGDLQYLLYIGKVYLSSENKPADEYFKDLLDKMTETVRISKILPVLAVNNKLIEDADIAAKILCECFPDKKDIFAWFDRNKTWYEGWNVPQVDELYDRCHKEGHLLCWMLMVASLPNDNDKERDDYWQLMMECLFGQLRAAGGYLKSEYTQVLVLAGMVAVQTYTKGLALFLKNCCEYVVKVDDLVVIVTNAGALTLLEQDNELRNALQSEVTAIAERMAVEWPLKQKRMNMEGVQAKDRIKAINNAVEGWKKIG